MTLKTAGYEKSEVAALRLEVKSKAHIARSWMATELPNEWVSNVLGSFAFGRRQLNCDANEYYIENSLVKA